MKISAEIKKKLETAVANERERVVAERTRRSHDYSRKWNDSDERIAISLDAQRDELDAILVALQKDGGSLEW